MKCLKKFQAFFFVKLFPIEIGLIIATFVMNLFPTRRQRLVLWGRIGFDSDSSC